MMNANGSFYSSKAILDASVSTIGQCLAVGSCDKEHSSTFLCSSIILGIDARKLTQNKPRVEFQRPTLEANSHQHHEFSSSSIRA
jgi:hypothetical protein